MDHEKWLRGCIEEGEAKSRAWDLLVQQRASEFGQSLEDFLATLGRCGDPAKEHLGSERWRTIIESRLATWERIEHLDSLAYLRRGFLDRQDLCQLPDKLASRKVDPRLQAFRSAFRWGTGALILGHTGTGKTTVAGESLVRESLIHRERIIRDSRWTRLYGHQPQHLFVRAKELGNEFRFGAVDTSLGGLIHRASNVPLLVIDDLGYESDVGVACVCEVIVARSGKQLPTVGTSGISKKLLVTRYKAAMLRRIMTPASIKGIWIDLGEKQ